MYTFYGLGREQMFKIRSDREGKVVKRSICGSIDDYLKTTEARNQG
jgi:hypothetical protein